MRQIDPNTGKPYLRKRPLRLCDAFRIARHRRAHEKLIADGWIELRSHSAFPGDLHIGGSGKYEAVCLHPDGSRIYVKQVGRNALELHDRALRQQESRINEYYNSL